MEGHAEAERMIRTTRPIPEFRAREIRASFDVLDNSLGDGEEVKMNDTPKDFEKDTKAIAKGGSKDVTDIFKKRQPSSGVGRNKR